MRMSTPHPSHPHHPSGAMTDQAYAGPPPEQQQQQQQHGQANAGPPPLQQQQQQHGRAYSFDSIDLSQFDEESLNLFGEADASILEVADSPAVSITNVVQDNVENDGSEVSRTLVFTLYTCISELALHRSD